MMGRHSHWWGVTPTLINQELDYCVVRYSNRLIFMGRYSHNHNHNQAFYNNDLTNSPSAGRILPHNLMHVQHNGKHSQAIMV
jgi:hypothetical protein